MTLVAPARRPVLADRVLPRSLVTDAVLVLAGAALVTLFSYLQVPLWPVPITGQTLAVLRREPTLTLAVNVSGRSLMSDAFVTRALELLSADRQVKGRLMFELTESAAVEDLATAAPGAADAATYAPTSTATDGRDRGTDAPLDDVRTTVSSILTKASVADRARAIIAARRTGLG